MLIGRLNSRSKVSEIDESIQQIVLGYDNSGIEDDLMRAMFRGIRYKSVLLSRTIGTQKAESRRSGIDEDRDKAYVGVITIVEGYLASPLDSLRNAAELVAEIFPKKSSDVTKASINVQSSIVKSLLTDLQEPAVVTAVEALPGLVEQIALLTAVQSELNEASLEWESVKAESDKALSASELKEKILPLVNDKLLLYLQGMAVASPNTHGEYARLVKQIVASNNSAVKRRSSN